MEPFAVAHESAVCLANLVQDDGRFRYRYRAESSHELGGYNVLRHAGAIWALLDVYRETEDSLLLKAGQRAITYLLDAHLRFYRDYRCACICEENKIKLGGNALAILALVSLYEFTKERFLLGLAEQLASYMLAERTKQGDFVHKRYFRSGKVSSFRSSYYTGEALFALVCLFEVTSDRQWLAAAETIEDRLAAQNYGVAEQSHWMLYFLEVFARHAFVPAYIDHAVRISRHILDHPDYLSWRRSTPIACRTEGLLALLRLPETVGIDEDLRQNAWRQVRENLERQLGFRREDGSFIRGGDDGRNEEVRIDYLQHNISSFLHFGRLAGRW